jgi:FKBP-type peptidyl-prolyl cis-trans isomerase
MNAARTTALAFGATLVLAACASEPATSVTDSTAVPASAPPPQAAPDADPRWPLSYAVGYNVGSNLSRAQTYTELAAFGQGLDDVWQQRSLRLDEAQIRQVLREVAQRLANPAPQAANVAPADFSYALGASVAISLLPVQERIDPAALKQAAAEAYQGKAAQVDVARRAELTGELQAAIEQRRQQAVAADKARAEQFLADNAGHAGVTVTASGLQYEVLQQGTGQRPTRSSRVSVNYTGRLLSGEVFDDDHQQGRPPASFALANVISGWIEGLQLMPVGSRYRFYIPPQLAYGERGAPPRIGPNQVLVFEVELLAIE